MARIGIATAIATNCDRHRSHVRFMYSGDLQPRAGEGGQEGRREGTEKRRRIYSSRNIYRRRNHNQNQNQNLIEPSTHEQPTPPRAARRGPSKWEEQLTARLYYSPHTHEPWMSASQDLVLFWSVSMKCARPFGVMLPGVPATVAGTGAATTASGMCGCGSSSACVMPVCGIAGCCMSRAWA